MDINNILVSKKESYGTKNSHKYFIGYKASSNDWLNALINALSMLNALIIIRQCLSGSVITNC